MKRIIKVLLVILVVALGLALLLFVRARLVKAGRAAAIASANRWSKLGEACDKWDQQFQSTFHLWPPFRRKRPDDEARKLSIENLTDPKVKTRYMLYSGTFNETLENPTLALPDGALYDQLDMLAWGDSGAIETYEWCFSNYMAFRLHETDMDRRHYLLAAIDSDSKTLVQEAANKRPSLFMQEGSDYKEFARKVGESFVSNFDKYRPEGQADFTLLMGGVLFYGALNVTDFPDELQQDIAKKARAFLPEPGSKPIDSNDVLEADSVSGRYLVALILLGPTRDAKLFPYYVDFIENYSDGGESEQVFISLFFVLHPPPEVMEPFLIKCMQNPSRGFITDLIIGCLDYDKTRDYYSERMRDALVPFISTDLSAARLIQRMPGFKELYAGLPRETQVLLIVKSLQGDLDSNVPLPENVIYADDAPILAKLLGNYGQTSTGVLQILKDSSENRTSSVLQTTRTGEPASVPLHMRPSIVRAAVEELQHGAAYSMLYYLRHRQSKHANRDLLIYGKLIQYLESVSGQKFWSETYGHAPTEAGLTKEDVEETSAKVEKWWEENQARFPAE